MDNLTNPAYGTGIGSLYRQPNPAERRIAISSKVAENAGFAAPFIYASMGKDMVEAENYDNEQVALSREAAKQVIGMKQQKQQMDEKEMQIKATGQVLHAAATVSPEAAAELFNAYKAKGMLGDIPLNFDLKSLSVEKGSVKIEAINGQVIKMDKNGVAMWDGSKKEYTPASEEAMQKMVAQKTPNEIELQTRAQNGDPEARAVLDRMQKDEVNVARESRPLREGKADKEETRTTDMKELDQINKERKAKGQVEMSLEEWKKFKIDANDPYGVKAAVREKLGGKKPVAPVTPVLNPKDPLNLGLRR